MYVRRFVIAHYKSDIPVYNKFHYEGLSNTDRDEGGKK